MNGRLKKIILLTLIAALFFGTSQIQRELNSDRDKLGLTHIEVLQNAPPVIAFATVALGGFRGLIANALWIRASELQDEDKFFEMAQLSDWITKLEPHFAQVWAHEAWNMAYNISVKFKDWPDRWRWVKRGIELLRDEGLKYNPNEILIYQNLGLIFQHKMGANLDDAHMYYKKMWAEEMGQIFNSPHPDWNELINPKTDEGKARKKLLIEKYKLDPAFMKECDDKYGPMEWRLPEAHAVYWGAIGLKYAEENPTRVNREDYMSLRRLIYQSMQLSFRRGKLIRNPLSPIGFDTSANIEIIPHVNASYEEAMEQEEKMRLNIATGHRNFLRDAVYYLYTSNREKDAAKWYAYLGKKYPNNYLLEANTNSLASQLTLDDYVFARVGEEVNDTDNAKTRALLEGLINSSLFNLVIDEYDRYISFENFAVKARARYISKTAARAGDSLHIATIPEIKAQVLERMLNPTNGLPMEMQTMLRSKLGLKPATNSPPAMIIQPAK